MISALILPSNPQLVKTKYEHFRQKLDIYSFFTNKKADWHKSSQLFDLFPLNRCRWLACNVIHDAVDVIHFVYDTR